MMTTKRLDNFEVVCEWASCNFKGHTMEELSDHMSLHLKDYLGDKDALEELDEYACLWNGCEFLSMGSPVELEVHAFFHNYHGKLKFVGSQLLKSRPALPSCNQGLHSNNLVPEGSDGYVCQWEQCDVGVCRLQVSNRSTVYLQHNDYYRIHVVCSLHRVHSTILSGSTDTWTITSKVPSSSPSHNSSRRCSTLLWHSCDVHVVSLHTQERLVACPTCGSMFSSNTKLFDHLHRQVKCPFCDMTCTTLAALKIHIRFRHCDERPFPCDFCDKRFKNQRDLQKHSEVHNEGTVYHCTVEGCDYSCHTFQTMSHHFKRAHEVGGMSKYKCHICDKVFSWCYTLTLHLRKKHELKWPSGHSRFRYRKDVDGFLKVNMVRFETVEVTKEIMKNMAKKPQSRRKNPRTSGRNKRAAVAPESGQSSPAGSSSPSSSSSYSYSSSAEFSGGEDVSSQPSPRGSDSPVYCVMSTIPHIEDEPGGLSQEDCDGDGTSGAVQALTEVARGLGMDVV
uniref:Zgc:112083 n=1 Tax=Scophthalmus maximus TaxID=52904 RepID=A0A8D3A9X0_SCOMX